MMSDFNGSAAWKSRHAIGEYWIADLNMAIGMDAIRDGDGRDGRPSLSLVHSRVSVRPLPPYNKEQRL